MMMCIFVMKFVLLTPPITLGHFVNFYQIAKTSKNNKKKDMNRALFAAYMEVSFSNSEGKPVPMLYV